MNMSTTVAAATTDDRNRLLTRSAIAAYAASLGLLILALTAWSGSGHGASADTSSLVAALWSSQVAVAVAGIASLIGLIALTIGWVVRAYVSDAARWTHRALTGLAGLEVIVLGIGLGSVTAISLAGYLVALSLPVLLGVLVVQVVRRYRRGRWVVLAAVTAFLGWGVATGALSPDSLARLANNLAGGFAAASERMLGAVLLTAATAAWGLVLLGRMRGTSSLARARRAVLRHRRVWTITAAICALPYGLIRLTWLTPWPLLAPGSETLGADVRLWGLLLGGGSILGFALTLGLIRPWGERFPRWMPRLAGRPVPVRVAAIPGGLVALVLCVSAVPMLIMLSLSTAGDAVGVDSLLYRALAALVFPFWLWGPMLALAVWGYVLHRGQAGAAART